MNFKTEKYIFNKLVENEINKKSREFYNVIKNRRSIRDFDKQKINIDIIKNAILSAGTAPNGANLQPWHFVIIKSKKIKKEIRTAAEKEEVEFYNKKAPKEWLKALEGKEFLEIAPFIIAIFEKKYSEKNKEKIKNYYVRESVGIATGILISCLHFSGLCMLTHTPNPMNFLNKILKRPANEKPFILLVVGYPKNNCRVPVYAKKKKKLKEIISTF